MEFSINDGLVKFGNILWFTNLYSNAFKHPNLNLRRSYNKNEYKTYDNYDAIEVGKLDDIPLNYCGVMGVPLRIISKNYSDLFDIVGLSNGRSDYECKPIKRYHDAIQHNQDGTTSNGGAINTGPNLLVSDRPTDIIYYTAPNVNGYLIQCYSRVFIRRKQ